MSPTHFGVICLSVASAATARAHAVKLSLWGVAHEPLMQAVSCLGAEVADRFQMASRPALRRRELPRQPAHGDLRDPLGPLYVLERSRRVTPSGSSSSTSSRVAD